MNNNGVDADSDRRGLSLIDGPAGALELRVSIPSDEQAVVGVGVICHPHPQQGGTLDNKVAYMLSRSCQQAGLAAVRFNFRGVGRSEGVFDHGRGEVDDLAAVIAWSERQWPDQSLALLGFSFGAYVAMRGAVQKTPRQLVTVAPPMFYFGDEPVSRPDCPWLVIQGDADKVIDPVRSLAQARELEPPPQIVVFKGVGHFFHGHLQNLRDAVVPVLRQRFR